MSGIGEPVLTWYSKQARPFLEQWSPERLPGLVSRPASHVNSQVGPS